MICECQEEQEQPEVNEFLKYVRSSVKTS